MICCNLLTSKEEGSPMKMLVLSAVQMCRSIKSAPGEKMLGPQAHEEAVRPPSPQKSAASAQHGAGRRRMSRGGNQPAGLVVVLPARPTWESGDPGPRSLMAIRTRWCADRRSIDQEGEAGKTTIRTNKSQPPGGRAARSRSLPGRRRVSPTEARWCSRPDCVAPQRVAGTISTVKISF